MPDQLPLLHARGGVEDPHDAVAAASGNRVASGRKIAALHPRGMSRQREHEPAGGELPDTRLPVGACRQKLRAVT